MLRDGPCGSGMLLFSLVVWQSMTGLAAEVTESRLAVISGAESAAWRAYAARSRAAAAHDRDCLAREVEAAGLTEATRCPSGGDFKPPHADDAEWYRTARGTTLIDAVLSFQTPSGGWSKHTGYSRGPRQSGMQWSSQSEPGKRPHYLGTIDNGGTTKEIRFLADAWAATDRADCKAAVNRGIDYLLAAQFPSGGWPQVYPLEGGYHDNITFNDDAMIHVLELFQDVATAHPVFACVGPAQRGLVADSLARGIECVLRSQIEINGRKTAWCAQHDPITLEPAAARSFEPASLSGVESSHVLRFLMGLPHPSPDTITAIEAGLTWLDAARMPGIVKVVVDGRTTYTTDDSPDNVCWARFYDLETGRPIFPGKDGIVYSTFEALAAANDKLGYDYLSTRPGSILRNGQKKWRKRMAAATAL